MLIERCPRCKEPIAMICNALATAQIGCPKQAYRAASRLTDAASVSTASPPKGYCPEAITRQAIAMYTEGMGYSARSRVPGVKPETIYSWVKKPFNLWLRWKRSGRGGGKLELRSYRLTRCVHMWAQGVAISAIGAGIWTACWKTLWAIGGWTLMDGIQERVRVLAVAGASAGCGALRDRRMRSVRGAAGQQACGWEVRRGEQERWIAFGIAREVESVSASYKGLLQDGRMAC